jgi:hypothetical protein
MDSSVLHTRSLSSLRTNTCPSSTLARLHHSQRTFTHIHTPLHTARVTGPREPRYPIAIVTPSRVSVVVHYKEVCGILVISRRVTAPDLIEAIADQLSLRISISSVRVETSGGRALSDGSHIVLSDEDVLLLIDTEETHLPSPGHVGSVEMMEELPLMKETVLPMGPSRRVSESPLAALLHDDW